MRNITQNYSLTSTGIWQLWSLRNRLPGQERACFAVVVSRNPILDSRLLQLGFPKCTSTVPHEWEAYSRGSHHLTSLRFRMPTLYCKKPASHPLNKVNEERAHIPEINHKPFFHATKVMVHFAGGSIPHRKHQESRCIYLNIFWAWQTGWDYSLKWTLVGNAIDHPTNYSYEATKNDPPKLRISKMLLWSILNGGEILTIIRASQKPIDDEFPRENLSQSCKEMLVKYESRGIENFSNSIETITSKKWMSQRIC